MQTIYAQSLIQTISRSDRSNHVYVEGNPDLLLDELPNSHPNPLVLDRNDLLNPNITKEILNHLFLGQLSVLKDTFYSL